jgi:hypothetical protein
VDGHEACVILEVTGPTQDLADQIAYFAFIRLYAGPYPGRKTTAGNVAIPYMPMVIPLGEAFSFNGYHILPVDHPMEPFASRVESFPRTAQR